MRGGEKHRTGYLLPLCVFNKPDVRLTLVALPVGVGVGRQGWRSKTGWCALQTIYLSGIAEVIEVSMGI